MQPFKDFNKHSDLLYSVRFHSDEDNKVTIFNFTRPEEDKFVMQIDNKFGTNMDCYDLYYKGAPMNSTPKLVSSDENSLTLEFDMR